MCFYCTQSDILLCGIARLSRGNRSRLRTFQSRNWKKKKKKKKKKIKSSQPQTKFTGSYKRECIYQKIEQYLVIFNDNLTIFDDRNAHTGARNLSPKRYRKFCHLSHSGNRALEFSF